MNKAIIVIAFLFSFAFSQAQTWTGTTNTNWNVATNWSPNVIPTGTSNIAIPGSVVSGNWPALSSNTSVNGITTSPGSQLNVNGFSFTVNGASVYNVFNGLTINNSSGSTDIVISINTGTGGYNTNFTGCTVNDNITFNITGSNIFYEGNGGPNVFNNNVLYNIGSDLNVTLGLSNTLVQGNISITRTVVGTTSLFSGGGTINGNFSYTNNFGGATGMGNLGIKTAIAGTTNITISNVSPAGFTMHRIINQVSGGTVNIQNSLGFDVRADTLKLAGFSVAYTGSAYSYLYNNSITGNLTVSNDAGYTNGYNTTLRNNIFAGTCSFTNNGTNALYEADAGGTANRYIGNATFNLGGSGPLYLSHGDSSRFDGNFTVNRTSPGHTQMFNAGATLNGNFIYNNSASGPSYLGNQSIRTSISGTINTNVNYTAPSLFEMFRIINQTTGGSFLLQNSSGFNMRSDTLKLATFSIAGYTGNSYGYFFNNSITGSSAFSDDATYTGGYYTMIRNNLFTGPVNFSSNSTNNFYEADDGSGSGSANHYTGNVTITGNAANTISLCAASASLFDANLSITRTVGGTTQAFAAGATIGGNFSYTNNTSGSTVLGGNSLAYKTAIAGTVNISAVYTTTSPFEMYRLVNLTAGGLINVQNSNGFNVRADTLKVTSFGINSYRGNQYGYLYNNSITGNTTLSDEATYSGGYATYIRANLFTGTASFTVNGTNDFYDADAVNSANRYTGNASFTATAGGRMFIAYSEASSFDANVTISRSAAGTTQAFNAGSIIGGNLSYTNNTAGDTYFGNAPGTFRTAIAGTINIAANYTAQNRFEMYHLVNQTAGGSISVQNSLGFNIYLDTLKVTAINLTGYRGGNYAYLTNNSITGNVTIADDASYGGGYATYIRGNTITGNTGVTLNGTNIFYDADAVGSRNRYVGNVLFARNAGTISVAGADTSEITGNLTLNSASNINLGKLKFNGNTNGIIDQLGTQPINIPSFVMEKTGAAKLTLNDSTTVTGSLFLNGGNIYSNATARLVFPDNIGYTGGSATSHIVGPVIKTGDDAFTFPLGSPSYYHKVGISAPANITDKFQAEYKYQNPTIAGFNTSLKAGSFGSANISNAGYWDVQRLAGTTNVTLSLGFATNTYEQYPVLANLKVAHWNGSQWDDHGNGGTTGTAADGFVFNATAITSFSPFAIAGVTPLYSFASSNPGPGPDGTPLKLSGKAGVPGYSVKLLPSGTYTTDSIFLVPNGSVNSFRLKDANGVEKDTSITAPVAPTTYASANGNGTVNFAGWRHFVYLKDASNNIIGAVKDNDLTLGNTTMDVYFSTANVATAPNAGIFLKRSFRITSALAPVGTRRVRLYISKTEFNDLVAADPASFPNGINSLTITKYTGPQEGALFNPIPGGNTIIIPNSAIAIADLGTMYSLDADVTGFSGFYIGGNNSKLNVCSGSTVSIPSNISGATYQWQADNGSGFANISNGGAYSGVTTSTLSITAAPAALYGYKYRCLVNGVTLSQEYTLKFTASWEGTISNVWENAANWSCAVVPDAATDVLINAGKANYPQVGASTTVRTIKVSTGATVTVKTGFNLTILK